MRMRNVRSRCFFFCVLFAIILAALYIIHPISGGIDGIESTGLSGALKNGEAVLQPLSLQMPVSNISVKIGTLLQKLQRATLKVEIQETATGSILHSQEFDATQLLDNAALSLKTELPQGNYTISFTPNQLEEGETLVLYANDAPGNACSMGGESQDYAVFLQIDYQHETAYYSGIFLYTCIAILVAVGGSLAVSGIAAVRKKRDAAKPTVIRSVIAFACLVLTAVLLYASYTEMLDTGAVSFLRNNRLRFYCIVFLISCFIWLTSEKQPVSAYLLLILLGTVWIFTDLKYSVIDESAHADIVRYIINNRFHFPRVYDNYEAVQGPVYYYASALLCGWLPSQYIYLGVRVFGLVLLALFALFTKKTLDTLQRAGIIHVSEKLIHVFLLAFLFNPNVLIRLTRVSNEIMACFMASATIYTFTKIMTEGYDRRKLIGLTVLCALSFLTKSTCVVLFGLVFLVCLYYKKWAVFVKQAALYLLILAPWFINNYRIYGALTGMKAHQDIVMQTLNPNMERPDVWHWLIYYFYSYFLNPESGKWYECSVAEEFSRTVVSVLFLVAVAVCGSIAGQSIRKKLVFEDHPDDRRRILFFGYTALVFVTIGMHLVQSLITYNNTLAANRLCFMLNGAICGAFMIGISRMSKPAGKYISTIVSVFIGMITTAMICGYIEIASSGIF